MKKLFYAALIGLVSNVAALPIYAQSLVSGSCDDDPGGSITQLYQLTHGQVVTLYYQPGQQVLLSGDAGGGAGLQGHSVVAVEFEPSGMGIGYGVAPDSLPVQDVTSRLQSGSNSLRLIAVDGRDTAWVTQHSPCPAPSNPVMMAANTADVAAVTPVAMAPVKDAAIITHSIAITETANSGKASLPVAEDGTDPVRTEILRRLQRIALGLTMLGIILALTLGSPRRWWQWLIQQPGWQSALSLCQSYREALAQLVRRHLN